jgi:hypothetical protein
MPIRQAFVLRDDPVDSTAQQGWEAMMTALIAALAGAVLYLGKRLLDARSETAELRAQVAFLKRRLSKAGH